MKLLFLSLLLLAEPVFCQVNIFTKNITTNQSETERWNLDKYLWSHTHYKTGKNDKPVIDFNALENWMSLGDQGNNGLSISPNGQYFSYTIDRGNRWDHPNLDSLVVQSTQNTWRRSFAKTQPGFFSADSRQYIFLQNGTVYFIVLGGSKIDSVSAVKSYKKPTLSFEWLAMQLNDVGGTVLVRKLGTKEEKKFLDIKKYDFDKSGQWFFYESFPDSIGKTKRLGVNSLSTGKQRLFSYVDSYLFDKKGRAFVVKKIYKSNNQKITSLVHVNLSNYSESTIWESTDTTIKINNYSLDGSAKQVVMSLSQNGQNSIWYWKEGMDNAVLKVNDQTEGIDKDMLIEEVVGFTDNSNYIKFSLQPKPDLRQPMPDAVQLDVWSYMDTILQSTQSGLLKEPDSYTTIFNLEKSQVIRLESQNEKIYNWLIKNDFAVVHKAGDKIYGDRFWEKDYNKGVNWLVSLKDGTRHLLPSRADKNSYSIRFSPGGGYLVYFDAEKGNHYFSYDLSMGKLTNISIGIPDNQLVYVDPYMNTTELDGYPAGIAGWLEGDQGVLVYDNYDVWQLDLTGKRPPLNITHGYGFEHKIVFTLENGIRNFPDAPTLSIKKSLLLKSFNKETKFNGFYRTQLGNNNNLELLYTGPYYWENMQPLKAANANIWIIQRQAAADAPNYFTTTNFKRYTRLTNLQPHKNFNWLTAELVSFKQLDGTISQGILYKPENFDSTNKYPVIISFYAGGLSDKLYHYQLPKYISSPDLDDKPAWMVSHGYLVFLPDIYFTQGRWGPSVVNTVDGAARYLSSLPYVDGKHLGAAGHSNSGRFGYYLLTHSKSFAAMALGSGHGGTDILSVALSDDAGLEWAENNSLGTGLGDIWQNKKVWIDHIALLQSDNVSSPLLLFHNKNEGDKIHYPFSDSGGDAVLLAKQLYTALRRQNKPVWWLQYDEGSHLLSKVKDLRDYTIRYTQFFDYFLKGAPEPKWMVDGLPYKLKGIESRYELYQGMNTGRNLGKADR